MMAKMVPSSAAPPRHKRRTQKERRETTRTALLEATIDCLVRHGYGNTTTRAIADRAGVSQGALEHHFANKAELVSEATRYLGAKLTKELLRQAPPTDLPLLLRAEEVFKRTWEVYRGAPVEAAIELWIAARTDPELRERLLAVERDMNALVSTGGASLYPEVAGRAGFAELAATALAAMRGLALLGYVDPEARDRAWPWVLAHLLRLTADLEGGARAPR
jgi:AcrR family transcriptional regulator